MYELPDSYEESFEHFHLPKHLKNVGVMSDIHIPYHSIEAIEEAINYFISKKVDSVFLNGDIIDCYMLSKFNPDPRKRHFRDEIEAFKQFIMVLKDNVSQNIFFKLGNHEERFEKTMILHAPEFLDIPASLSGKEALQSEFSGVIRKNGLRCVLWLLQESRLSLKDLRNDKT